MANIFTKHPKEAGESYLQHLLVALKYSFTLFLLFLISFIHSIFPFIFRNTTSSKIIKMAEDLKTRK
jgi:hypothetical protein